MKCRNCSKEVFLPFTKSLDYISNRMFSIVLCKHCRLVQTDISEHEDMNRHYDVRYYGSRKGGSDSIITKLRLYKIRTLLKRKTIKRVLDIGAGNGAFLILMRAHGWDVAATEQGTSRIQELTALNIPVCTTDLSTCTFKEHSFSLITIWHVLEHVQNPKQVLSASLRYLDQDGTIVIEVPNIDSWQARLYKGYWFGMDVPRHITHFSPQTIHALLADNGLRVTKTTYFEPYYDVFCFVQSALNLVCRRYNFFYDLINGKVKLTQANYIDMIKTVLLVAPLTIAGMMAFIVSLPFSKGAIMTLYVQKQ